MAVGVVVGVAVGVVVGVGIIMAQKNPTEEELRMMIRRGHSKEHGSVVGTRRTRGDVGTRADIPPRKGGPAGSNPAHAPLSQQFFVPGPLPGANDIIRKHHMVYSRLKAKWGLEIGRCLLIAKIKPIRSCAITYHWIEPIPVRGHIRDRDNIRFGAKFINDALVTHGILIDDGPDGVARLTDTFEYHAANPGVLITLEEAL